MPDDALPLHSTANHESRHVGQVEQGDAEGIALPDEAGTLVGRINKQHPTLDGWLIRHDADHLAVQKRKARHQFRGKQRLDLEEGVFVHDRLDDRMNVVACCLLRRYKIINEGSLRIE